MKEITLVGLNNENLNSVQIFAPKIISIVDVDLMHVSTKVGEEPFRDYFPESGLNLIEMDVNFHDPLRVQQFMSFLIVNQNSLLSRSELFHIMK